MVEQHARTGIAHYRTHPFTHTGAVTMDGTLLAGRLLLAIAAMRKACVGILQQLPAVGAKRGVAFSTAAIQGNHLLHHALFFFDT